VKSEEWTAGSNDRGRSPTRWAWSENGAFTHKDVKNEGRSGNVYENKGSNDTMTENYSGFCAWLGSFLQKWTTNDGSFWQKMHRKCGNWGEAGTRIGSAVYRTIAPSADPQVVLRRLDQPMDRWSDRLAFPLCTRKQKRLVINSENLAKIHVAENKIVS